MKYLSFIFAVYVLSTGCRSSYDEARHKPEISAQSGSANSGPIVETPSVVPSPTATTEVTTPANGSGTPADTSGTSPNGTQTSAGEDPGSLRAEHNASAEELKKYNCKGTALITDSGMDDNKDGILQDDEIQETRIDCTEVVPGMPATP